MPWLGPHNESGRPGPSVGITASSWTSIFSHFLPRGQSSLGPCFQVNLFLGSQSFSWLLTLSSWSTFFFLLLPSQYFFVVLSQSSLLGQSWSSSFGLDFFCFWPPGFRLAQRPKIERIFRSENCVSCRWWSALTVTLKVMAFNVMARGLPPDFQTSTPFFSTYKCALSCGIARQGHRPEN